MAKVALVLLCLTVLCAADLEKLSSSVYRNGTEMITYFTPLRLNYRMNLAFQTSTYPNTYFWLFPELEPQWIDWSNIVDAHPDINKIGDNEFRLYFTAVDKATKKSAIGVAITDSLLVRDYRYTTLPAPILVARAQETLTHPSLYQAANGTLYLYYHNTTAGQYGRYDHVTLSNDGLRVLS